VCCDYTKKGCRKLVEGGEGKRLKGDLVRGVYDLEELEKQSSFRIKKRLRGRMFRIYPSRVLIYLEEDRD